ncbi:MAG: aminoacyl-histidine dipeptidase, partial [Planctomycetota bacterium]
MTFVAELEPKSLWSHFDEILKIPRASKDEGRMRDHVVAVAEKSGLSHKVDAAGNLVVSKPGTAGHEGAPVTIIQAHLDMVQEKNSDVDHDFSEDAIQPVRDGDYVKASGTTLGSDNGIGVASMLAVMEATDIAHGPLELLFTVDEETGLTGAAGLANDMLEGRQLINVDSEEEGVLTIGCAGGADSHVSLPLGTTSAPAGSFAIEVHLTGLKGGHSGIDIHRQRGNASQLLARALFAASLGCRIHLAAFEGGNAHNAIPREAKATVVIPGADAVAFRKALLGEFEAIRTEYRPAEPGMELNVTDVQAPPQVWDADATAKVINLVNGLPHGVMSMSYDIPGLVETSTNLAVVGETDGEFKVWMSSRSSVSSALEALRRRIRSSALLAGAAVDEDEGYPGWKPDVSSRMLAVVKQVHVEVSGKEPEIGAVHAGLECGIIGEKYSGMDMISFGPQIEFPHSPDERVKVD